MVARNVVPTRVGMTAVMAVDHLEIAVVPTRVGMVARHSPARRRPD